MNERVFEKPRAVVLLSGGLDSATALAIAQAEGFSCYALSFRYGQRHSVELLAAQRIAEHRKVVRHLVIDIDLRMIGGSALTADIAVPKSRNLDDIGRGIPVTYVPARNTIFLSFALAWAEVVEAQAIFIGVNALDYSGYPDCRPEFISAFENVAALGTRVGIEEGFRVKIHAPLMQMDKADIVRKGMELGVDFSLTHSCYDPTPEGLACGSCDACLLRQKGFAEAGHDDPIAYRTQSAMRSVTPHYYQS